VRTSGAADLEYGTIARGTQATNRASFGDYFTVELSLAGCMVGTSVTLTATARDESNRSWTFPVMVPVVESDARIEFVSVRFTDSASDSTRNNANGRAEPGEVLRLDLTLRNAGGSDARGVRVSLAAPAGCAAVRTSGASDLAYGNIARGTQATNRASFGDYFTVDLSPSLCAAGSTVMLTFRANDASDRGWSGSLPIRIQ
jgi:uncharacterized repeat protein (TIGR01451 family)